MNRRKPLQRSALALVMLVMSAGCAPLDLSDRLPWTRDEVPTFPDRMVPMWKDTVFYEPGAPGVRGFGARIYFYEKDANEPTMVEGTLVVYAFDAGDTSGMPKPRRKYVFTSEQFAKHYSKTSIGHSYSIWLPWDNVGGPTEHLSLVAKFVGDAGGSIVTDPARKLLPGMSSDADAPDAEDVASDNDGPAEDDSRNVPAAFNSPVKPASDLPSVTIQLPPSFSRKLQRTGTGETPADSDPRAGSSAVNPLPSVAPAEDLPYRQRVEDHFEQRKSQARNSSRSRPIPARRRKQPLRAKWLSGLPPTPRSAPVAPPDDD